MGDATSPKYGLALLGGFELTGPAGVVDLGGKLAGLLAYLACTSPRPQSRERLATLLWGSHFDAQARQNLRQALSRLRGMLDQRAVQSDDEVVWLDATFVDCDIVRFEVLVSQGSREALRAAADLYRGRLVDNIAIREETFNGWLAGERGRLHELALGALVRLGEQELAAGQGEAALKAGRRAVALDPLREDAHRLVMQALAATGRKAEALKHYQDLAALLKRELNAEPDAPTRSLVAGLHAAEPSDTTAVTIARTATAVTIARTATAVTIAKTATGSERRQLTIMACTIVGSEALSSRLDPEGMRDLLASFQARIGEVASRFDGFVAQCVGDAVFVYFGYPIAREHDAEQAVRAGFAVHDAVGSLSASPGVPLRARIGIATGLVVVGDHPGTIGLAHIAIGETPELAARLQAVASPGEVVIAHSTRRLVGRRFDCRSFVVDQAAGSYQVVQAWQVRAETTGISRFEARLTGTLSPLVGRQEEMERLSRRWEQVIAGEGQVALLSGEPGIGKSRICESLLARLEGAATTRLRYFCSPHHENSPLFPFITQLEQAAGFEPGRDAAARLDKLAASLEPRARNASRDVALIAELLGVPTVGRYPPLSLSPRQKREMTLAALLDQVEGAAALGPVLIVFEDAHWTDPTSQELLDRMVARAARLPVLLVVTVRPELQPNWVGEPHVTTLPLSRLGRRDSATIIGRIAKDKVLPDTVVEHVLAGADGIPLFLEELTSTLLESGLLRETTDRYVLDRPLPPLALPSTLQASLVARLDRLGSVNKEVAQIGAAIGREFTHELIAAVSPPGRELDAALERLVTSGLVFRRGTPPDAAYTFKHALVQDAAYTTMIRSLRQSLHGSIATVLVERFAALAEGQPEVVAHHFTEAGLVVDAVRYWRKAGQLSSVRSAGHEAVSAFERALGLLDAMPQNTDTLEQGIEIRLELRSSLQWISEGRRLLDRLREAEALAERLNDDRRRCHVGAFRASAHASFGELDQAVAAGNRTLAIARRLGDATLGMLATNSLEQAHYYRGDYGRVVELAIGNLAALPAGERTDDHFLDTAPPSTHDRYWLMHSLAQLGRFAESTGYETESIEFAEATQNLSIVAYVHAAAGTHHIVKGDWTRARALVERGIAAARSTGVMLLLGQLVASSAWVLAQHGEAGEAANRLREGEQLVHHHAARGFSLWTCHALGRASLLLGRLDEARRLADQVIESSRHRGFAAHALHLLGDVATHPDCFDAEQGAAHFARSLGLAEPLGMRPLAAHCHLGLGKICLRMGNRDRARDHVTTAATTYRDLGMTYWMEQAEAQVLQRQ